MKQLTSTLDLLLLLILIHTTSCAVLRNRTNNEPGLYTSEDDLYILTIDNFNTTIYNSDKAWMVEFYSNWCGFCRRAVPRVKAFGTDIKGWNDLVVLAVLDCANERNAPVCEFFGITRYPTFRYIHEHYMEGPENIGLPVVADSHTNFSEHRKNLVDILIKEQREGRAKMLPNLQPFKSSAISNIYSTNGGNPDLAFLIVQEPGDDTGPSIIMDFHSVKEIVIRYTHNNETNVTTEELPALYLIYKSGDLQHLNISSPNREGIKFKLRELLFSRNIEVPPAVLRNITITDEVTEPVNLTEEYLEFEKKIRAAGDTVFQLDLENALRYSLKREVGGIQKISGEKLDALRKYMNVLVKYFPFGEKGKQLLRHLEDYVNSSSEIDGHHIAEHIKEVDQPGKNVFSGPERWLGCRGSSPTHQRGYPCGLWKLFHFLVTNAALDPSNTQDTKPTVVLEAMHGYIKNYFGCVDCSEHFQDMAKRRKLFEVQSWEESVLWLWRAHNEVNKRLSGDATEDPRNKKIQFPSIQRCLKCYRPDGTWQEVEVLAYLKEMYRADKINYMYSDPRIVHQKVVNSKTPAAAAAAISTSHGNRIINTNHGLLLGGLLLMRHFSSR
ncbi:sulfhydryl oxidase 2-like [Diabrotica virgifera virgifera]|uniref:Sulfhydryl oxidase n=1 Tax=Diabrotica virgifera virgifera TaxID=50390 RepID=A0A6P7H8K8_DIAVI|nr:sulfhydryl oxidase 2-like [Diabrotica virgifera virgifera]XP_050514455.1 sulfhydryl oxidase 2-like [Diabrotica virgifera virgifera]